jgi:glycosyltransferase involved in cell wall biosynthesis
MLNEKYPLVTVIIPTFNRGFVVFKSIDSVLNQSYKNIQCIVIDDGSSDDTKIKIQPYLDRVEYYYQDNQGQGSARNLGLQYAKGEFIATLDSDDEWMPDFITTHLEQMLIHDLTLTFSNYEVYNAKFGRMSQIERMKPYLDSLNLNQWHIVDGSVFRDLVVPGVIIPSSGVLKRRSALTYGWDTNVKIADDWMLQLEIAMNADIKVGFTFEENWIKGHFGDNISLTDVSEKNRMERHYKNVHSDLLYVIQTFSNRWKLKEGNYLMKKLINFKLEWLIWRLKNKKPFLTGFSEFKIGMTIYGVFYFTYVLIRRIIFIVLKRNKK